MSFFHNGNEIEIHNSWMGKETIKYNGEIMSSKYSFMGEQHEFAVLENDVWIDYIVEIGFANYGVGFNIYRNNEPLIEALSKSSCCKKYRTSSDFV